MIIVQIALSCLLLVGVAAGRPQDSYLAPAASEAVALYSSPSEVVETYDEATADLFDLPDLAAMDDGIANGTHESAPGEARPLALFTAPLDRAPHANAFLEERPEWAPYHEY